ncbi:hypothetical protein PoB_007702600 [Plakobranchus ocellatus]|uniref:Uncharacterized protein n=1 Tax=Plakobranchus ocellatus TaxID=259542 RepID=A0AAV4E3K5_9GAST|nr:hypothetical protein PoB_007702600 [Plakobranchus ocellatus]
MLKWTSKPPVGAENTAMHDNSWRTTEASQMQVKNDRHGSESISKDTCGLHFPSDSHFRAENSNRAAIANRVSNLPFSYTNPVASHKTEYPYLKRFDAEVTERSNSGSTRSLGGDKLLSQTSPASNCNTSGQEVFFRSKSMPRLGSPISSNNSFGLPKVGILSKMKKMFRKSKDDDNERRCVSQPSSPKTSRLSKTLKRKGKMASTSSEVNRSRFAHHGVLSSRLKRRLGSKQAQRKKFGVADIGSPVKHNVVQQEIDAQNHPVRNESLWSMPSACDETRSLQSLYGEPKPTFETFKASSPVSSTFDIDEKAEKNFKRDFELFSETGQGYCVKESQPMKQNYSNTSIAREKYINTLPNSRVYDNDDFRQFNALQKTFSEIQLIPRERAVAKPRSSYSKISVQTFWDKNNRRELVSTLIDDNEHSDLHSNQPCRHSDSDSMNSLQQFAKDVEAMLESQPQEEEETDKAQSEHDIHDLGEFCRKNSVYSVSRMSNIKGNDQQGQKQLNLNPRTRAYQLADLSNVVENKPFEHLAEKETPVLSVNDDGDVVNDDGDVIESQESMYSRKARWEEHVQTQAKLKETTNGLSPYTEANEHDSDPRQLYNMDSSSFSKTNPNVDISHSQMSLACSSMKEPRVDDLLNRQTKESRLSLTCSPPSQTLSISSLKMQAFSASFTSKSLSPENGPVKNVPHAKNNNNGHSRYLKGGIVLERQHYPQSMEEDQKSFKAVDWSEITNSVYENDAISVAQQDNLNSGSKEEVTSNIGCSPVHVKTMVNQLEQQIRKKVEYFSGSMPSTSSQAQTRPKSHELGRMSQFNCPENEKLVEKEIRVVNTSRDRAHLEATDAMKRATHFHNNKEVLDSEVIGVQKEAKQVSEKSDNYMQESSISVYSLSDGEQQSVSGVAVISCQSDNDLSSWRSHTSNILSIYGEGTEKLNSNVLSEADSTDCTKSEIESMNHDRKSEETLISDISKISLKAKDVFDEDEVNPCEQNHADFPFARSFPVNLSLTFDSSLDLLKGKGITDVTPPHQLLEVNSSPGEFESLTDQGQFEKTQGDSFSVSRDEKNFKMEADVANESTSNKSNADHNNKAPKKPDSILSPAYKSLSPVKKTVSFKLDTTPIPSESLSSFSDDAAICETISPCKKAEDLSAKETVNIPNSACLTDESVSTNESLAVTCKTSAPSVKVTQTSSASADDLSWWGANHEDELHFFEEPLRAYEDACIKSSSSDAESKNNCSDLELSISKDDHGLNPELVKSVRPEDLLEKTETKPLPQSKPFHYLVTMHSSQSAEKRTSQNNFKEQLSKHKNLDTNALAQIPSRSEGSHFVDIGKCQSENVSARSEIWIEPSESNSKLHTYDLNKNPSHVPEKLYYTESQDVDIDGLVVDIDASSALSDLVDQVENSAEKTIHQSTKGIFTKSPQLNEMKIHIKSDPIDNDIPFWQKKKPPNKTTLKKNGLSHTFSKKLAVPNFNFQPCSERPSSKYSFLNKKSATKRQESKSQRRLNYGKKITNSLLTKAKQLPDIGSYWNSPNKSLSPPEEKKNKDCKREENQNLDKLPLVGSSINSLGESLVAKETTEERKYTYKGTDTSRILTSYTDFPTKEHTKVNISRWVFQRPVERVRIRSNTSNDMCEKYQQLEKLKTNSKISKSVATSPYNQDDMARGFKCRKLREETRKVEMNSDVTENEILKTRDCSTEHESCLYAHAQEICKESQTSILKPSNLCDSEFDAGFSSDSISAEIIPSGKAKLDVTKHVLSAGIQQPVHSSSEESLSDNRNDLTYSVLSNHGVRHRQLCDRRSRENRKGANDHWHRLLSRQTLSCSCNNKFEKRNYCQNRQSNRKVYVTPTKKNNEKLNQTDFDDFRMSTDEELDESDSFSRAHNIQPPEWLFIATFFMFQMLLHWFNSGAK